MIYLAPKYMTRFHCITDKCEDTCCYGWNITFNDKEHARLYELFNKTDEDRVEFLQNVLHVPDTQGGHHDYRFRLNDDGRCSFLTPQSLCAIHQRFGEKALLHLCALFPRTLFCYKDRLEVVGSLACPEIARLCLLADDAMQLTHFSTDIIPKGHTYYNLNTHPSSAYLHFFHVIRDWLYALISNKSYPLATRLFFAAYFFNRISSYFNQEATLLYAEKVHADMRHVEDERLQKLLHDQLEQTNPSGAVAINIIMAIIKDMPPEKNSCHRLTALFRQALQRFGSENKVYAGEEVYRKYQEAVKNMDEAIIQRWERHLTHFILNQILRHWYFEFENVLLYWRDILLSVMILKFLFIGTLPNIDSAQPQIKNNLQKVDQHAVWIIQQFARSLLHASPLLTHTRQSLDEKGLNRLAHMVLLIKF